MNAASDLLSVCLSVCLVALNDGTDTCCNCMCVSICMYRLQYKYMKLVASSSDSSKLPAAETCALDEGEDDDDDDDEHFDAVKVRKGARFFQKLKMSGASHDAKVCCY